MERTMKRIVRTLARVTLACSLAVPTLSSAGSAPARPAGTLVGIDVSLKVDPRITRGLYMGDRWVAPTRYSRVQDGKKLVVEARAFGLDHRRALLRIDATWASADPRIVTVSPAKGGEVTLTVHRAGQTTLTISHGTFSRRLAVRASEERGSLRVNISRADGGPAGAAVPVNAPANGSGGR
jgi:hypothetical protein